LDNTGLQFQSDNTQSCQTETEKINLGTAFARANASLSPYLYIENEQLHAWDRGNGVIGLSYCIDGTSYDCAQLTPFQELVQNASMGGTDDPFPVGMNNTNLVFGLDFRTSDPSGTKYVTETSFGADASAMQIGAIDANFANRIVWTQQPTVSPDYHQFFLNNLEFCSAETLGNYSTNWQVLVDTGSVCVSLPDQIYDSFAAWFEGNATMIAAQDLDRLPAFSFQVGDGTNRTTIYVPLVDLLVNDSAIDTEPGAPYVTIRDENGAVRLMRLCVLRLGGISYESAGQTIYYTSAPPIILGSLALQSMYFAADFGSHSVGLANKLAPGYIQGFSAGSRVGCAPVRNCTGDQTYGQMTNTCSNPQCTRYFFTELNHDTMKCEPNRSNMIGGLIFIILVALAESVSYIVTQYSAHTALNAAHAAAMDPVTKFAGRWLSFLVDLVVTYLLSWAPRRNPTRVMAADGGGAANYELPGQQQ
jgi:hypothetical protein